LAYEYRVNFWVKYIFSIKVLQLQPFYAIVRFTFKIMRNSIKIYLIVAVLLISPGFFFGQTFSFGTVSNFALFTGNGAVSNTGTSNFTGDIGSDVGAISGFGTSTVNGSFYNTDAITAQAKTDLFIAYSQLMLIPVTDATHTPSFGGGETLTTGVYTIAGAGSLGGTLTLNGLGDTNAVFIFRFGGAYAVGASSFVILTNGARACNIFWIAEGAITLAANTTMKGTLLANNAAVSAAVGCDIEGRMLTTTGAVAFGPGDIYIPTCASSVVAAPPPPCCNPGFGATIDFVIYTSNGALNNTGASVLTRNVGTDIGVVNGYASATVAGTLHNADALTAQTKLDLFSLYSQLFITTVTNGHASVFGGGETITTGVYDIGSAASLAGNLILDAQNDTNAIFIFKIRGAFTVAALSEIILINLAPTCSVFWIVEGAISIGTGSIMKGTYIANNAAISMLNGGNLRGRLFSTNGAIAIDEIDADNTAACHQQTFPPPPLPIELLSFEAECENQNITLEWSTASEINNDYFTIERSIDGLNWEIITTVEGAGNSNSAMHYSFIDISNSFEISYYRLKQTDFDGNFKYSSIITVKNCEEDFTELSLYPNPANKFLNISIKIPEEEIVSVSIYNLIGKLIYYSETYQPHIVFEEKLNGIYILQIELNTKIIVKKFVVNN
jgi:hypothetical protein